MALVSDLVKIGISAEWAKTLGDTFASVAAAGTTINDAANITDSIILCSSSSGANAGLKLPKIDASRTKRHRVYNESGGNIRVYLNDSAVEGFKFFGPSGAATYVTVSTGTWVTIEKIAAGTWGVIG